MRTTSHPHPTRLLPLAAAAGVLALAACGSSTTPTAGPTSAGSSDTTVLMATVGGADVLTTPAGRTLYTSAQEDGTVKCTSSDCTAIWIPLTVPAGRSPTAPSSLTGVLGTTKRPDGTTQVTLDRHPLYTFSFDHAAGDHTGDGASDSFGGVAFTWHLAVADASTGGTPMPPASTSAPAYPAY